MRERAWTFFDRAFLPALAVSAAWHLFWFFAVTIVVSTPKRPTLSYPKIVSLGPLFDDAIMRTLVETRAPLSESFYRGPARPLEEIEPVAETVERGLPADTAGLPAGTRFLDAMRALFAGEKEPPGYDGVPRAGVASRSFGMEGELAERNVITRPPAPFTLPPAEIRISLAVSPAGQVLEVGIVSSCGNSAVDAEWAAFVRGWRFAPRPGGDLARGEFRAWPGMPRED